LSQRHSRSVSYFPQNATRHQVAETARLLAVSRVDDWWSEKPRRSPAEYAGELAQDRFWRDEQLRLIGTHPDWPDVAQFLELEDPSDPRAAASLAVAEVLDPSSEVVAVQEVVARSAWVTVERQEPPRVLGFLLEVDRLFADCR